MRRLGLLHQHAEGARSTLEFTLRMTKDEHDRAFEQVDLLKSERVVLQSEVEQAVADLGETREEAAKVHEELSAAQIRNERLRKSLDRAGQAAEAAAKERDGKGWSFPDCSGHRRPSNVLKCRTGGRGSDPEVGGSESYREVIL